MRDIRVIVLRRTGLWTATIAILCLSVLGVFARLVSVEDAPTAAPAVGEYVVFAMNDLGMHCIQSDYSSFMILPPANNLKVQVFRKGKGKAYPISSGVTVTYEVVDNTTSADKLNFWQYAKDYGYDVPPNIGITGNGLKGVCKLSADGKYYEAKAIPLTPYLDGSKQPDPYQIARVTVKSDQTGAILATANKVVLPVSDEMECGVCHGKTGTDLNILTAHDKRSKTHLVADLKNGVRHKCAECHQDNILGEKGLPGVPALSLAMHSFHSGRMAKTPYKPVCMTCHPGPNTKCYRGVMYAAGVSCSDARCHGDMAQVAASQKSGRQAWLQEPDCAVCHGAKYSTNSGELYKNSYLENSPAPGMNGLIQCQSCHNSTHAEWKSTLPLDNELPISLLGYASFIDKCTVCHGATGKMHR